MEEEWHVSESEDENEKKYYTRFITSNLKGLCRTVSNQDIDMSHSDQLHIPKNLNALYRQIENDGFIALQCKGSKRRLEAMKNDTHDIDTIINNHTNRPNSPTCDISNDTQAAEAKDEVPSSVKKLRSEFDYDEEMMEIAPVVRLPRRKQKSEHDKYRKTKRVGTMETVINNLDRFERLNAQALAADNVHSSNS